MANFLITDTLLTQIANAIRGKDGTSAGIQVSNFPARITAIPSGGGGDIVRSIKSTYSQSVSWSDFIESGKKYSLTIIAEGNTLANAQSACTISTGSGYPNWYDRYSSLGTQSVTLKTTGNQQTYQPAGYLAWSVYEFTADYTAGESNRYLQIYTDIGNSHGRMFLLETVE